jgi:FkbM family methyltransferase
MRLVVPVASGEPVELECEDTIASAWTSREILEDRTYPSLPFVPDVRVVVDAGANCGAASVHFARLYPNAAVHAVEPGSSARAYLERNAARYPNITVHPIGLHDVDAELPLYRGDGDLGQSSIEPSAWTLEESEMIQVRAAGAWAAEQGIERIDVLKLDVEGCEIAVLESLAHLLPDLKVLYVEYDSRQARRDLGRLLDPTHELLVGSMFLDQGECVYLRRDLADTEAATERLVELFRRGLADRGRPDPVAGS